MKMAGEELLFKKIDSPVEFRRNILEASKIVVHSLQKYERLKAVRIKKAELVIKLKDLVREIDMLTTKLKKEFPDLIFKTKEIKRELKKEKKEPESKKEKEAKPDKKPSRELVDLEKQLKEIESKLESIS